MSRHALEVIRHLTTASTNTACDVGSSSADDFQELYRRRSTDGHVLLAKPKSKIQAYLISFPPIPDKEATQRYRRNP